MGTSGEYGESKRNGEAVLEGNTWASGSEEKNNTEDHLSSRVLSNV
jgi:hypothetical protein